MEGQPGTLLVGVAWRGLDMCGRFTLVSPQRAAAELFGDDGAASGMNARYNVAPSQELLALRSRAADGAREAARLRWGLVPFWSKDESIGNRLINARAETVADKPSFRTAFRERRCLIAADGFYEWGGSGSAKTPYHIALADARPFAMAGLWERWQGEGERVVESCTIITTSANQVVEPIHPRMPVIIDPRDYETWLSGRDREHLDALLAPYPSTDMVARAVSPRVNNPRNDDAQCLEKA